MNSIYNFKVKSINGEEISLNDYKDKTLLIVNVASKCGFTPQYKELESLYQKYKNKNFIILAFPCNQFGKQESGTDEEILSFCQLTYDVTFPIFSKIEVNGKNEHALYKFLKEQKAGLLGTKNIKWNFTKFLVNKNGKVVQRFASKTTPLNIEKKIKELL